jgi:hypothetical protein
LNKALDCTMTGFDVVSPATTSRLAARMTGSNAALTHTGATQMTKVGARQ